MDVYALSLFRVDIARDVIAAVDDEAAPARVRKLSRAHGPEKPRPDDEIVVFHVVFLSVGASESN
jgi:hypothetical protein